MISRAWLPSPNDKYPFYIGKDDAVLDINSRQSSDSWSRFRLRQHCCNSVFQILYSRVSLYLVISFLSVISLFFWDWFVGLRGRGLREIVGVGITLGRDLPTDPNWCDLLGIWLMFCWHAQLLFQRCVVIACITHKRWSTLSIGRAYCAYWSGVW